MRGRLVLLSPRATRPDTRNSGADYAAESFSMHVLELKVDAENSDEM